MKSFSFHHNLYILFMIFSLREKAASWTANSFQEKAVWKKHLRIKSTAFFSIITL